MIDHLNVFRCASWFIASKTAASRVTLTQAIQGLSLYFRKPPQTTRRTVYQMFKYDNSILYCIKTDMKLALLWNNGSDSALNVPDNVHNISPTQHGQLGKTVRLEKG